VLYYCSPHDLSRADSHEHFVQELA